jgi:maintenance of morphology protein 1
MVSFARLPIALTISLSQFKSSVSDNAASPALLGCANIQTTDGPEQISIIPPSPDSQPPVLSLSISPNFVLDLTTTSLMGSRAKLANVPKLHELIQHQVRRVLAARATWKFVLPGLASIAQAQEKAKKDCEGDCESIFSS